MISSRTLLHSYKSWLGYPDTHYPYFALWPMARKYNTCLQRQMDCPFQSWVLVKKCRISAKTLLHSFPDHLFESVHISIQPMSWIWDNWDIFLQHQRMYRPTKGSVSFIAKRKRADGMVGWQWQNAHRDLCQNIATLLLWQFLKHISIPVTISKIIFVLEKQ